MDILFRSFYIAYGLPLAITIAMLILVEKWYLRIYDATPNKKVTRLINVSVIQKNLTSRKLGTYLAFVGLVGGLIFGFIIMSMANALNGNFWVVSLVYVLMLLGIAVMGDHLAQRAYLAQQRDWQDKLIRYQKGHSYKSYRNFNNPNVNVWEKDLDKITEYILSSATIDEYTAILAGSSTRFTKDYYEQLHKTTDRKTRVRMVNRYQDLIDMLKKTLNGMPTHQVVTDNPSKYHKDKVVRLVAVILLVILYIILGLDSFGAINIMGTLFPTGAPMGILLLVTLVKLLLIVGLLDLSVDKTKDMLASYITSK